jgi:hypothetical protein
VQKSDLDPRAVARGGNVGPKANASNSVTCRANTGGFVLVSLCYVVLGRLLQLILLCARSNDFKELEIVVLRHELAVLRRRTGRPANDVDRPVLSGGGQPLAAAQPLAILRRHAGDAVALASAVTRAARSA